MNGQCMVVGAGKCEEGGGSSGETTCLTQAKGLGGLEFAGWEMEERLGNVPIGLAHPERGTLLLKWI